MSLSSAQVKLSADLASLDVQAVVAARALSLLRRDLDRILDGPDLPVWRPRAARAASRAGLVVVLAATFATLL